MASCHTLSYHSRHRARHFVSLSVRVQRYACCSVMLSSTRAALQVTCIRLSGTVTHAQSGEEYAGALRFNVLANGHGRDRNPDPTTLTLSLQEQMKALVKIRRLARGPQHAAAADGSEAERALLPLNSLGELRVTLHVEYYHEGRLWLANFEAPGVFKLVSRVQDPSTRPPAPCPPARPPVHRFARAGPARPRARGILAGDAALGAVYSTDDT